MKMNIIEFLKKFLDMGIIDYIDFYDEGENYYIELSIRTSVFTSFKEIDGIEKNYSENSMWFDRFGSEDLIEHIVKNIDTYIDKFLTRHNMVYKEGKYDVLYYDPWEPESGVEGSKYTYYIKQNKNGKLFLKELKRVFGND